MMHGFGGSMGFGMGFGWIVWLIIIGVAVWAIVRLTQNTHQSNAPQTQTHAQETPLDILKKRYARGDITKEEYEERRKNL